MALPTTVPVDPTGGISSGLAAAQKRAQLYDQSDEDLQANLSASEEAKKALEARYASPNWFNVAAGFFKPQLGGFSASLGSASQALGEFQEQQRANQIPLYNAEQQIQLQKGQIANFRKAQSILSDFRARGMPVGEAPSVKSQLSRLGADSLAENVQSVIDNATKLNENNLRIQGLDQSKIELELKVISDSSGKYSLEQKEAALKKIGEMAARASSTQNASSKTTATPADLNTPAPAAPVTPAATNLPIGTGKGGEGSSVAQGLKDKNRQEALAFESQTGEAAKANETPFSTIAAVYPLFHDPGVQMAMGSFKQNTVESWLRSVLSGQSVSGAAQELALRVNPDIEKKYPGTIDKLQQILAASATLQLAVNNTTQNPNRATNAIEKDAVFSPNDTWAAAARKALLAMHSLQLPAIKQTLINDLNKEGLSKTEIEQDPRYKDLVNDWNKKHSIIANPKGLLVPTLPPMLRTYYPEVKTLEQTVRGNASKNP